MQRITTHLWFDNEAREAAAFYASSFSSRSGSPPAGEDSRITNITTLPDTPSGPVEELRRAYQGR
jgi:predicted 3-demethylubiquinone-9 3-methyltransferase (glyoxalase superfamily)